MIETEITFKSFYGNVEKSKYSNGRLALLLIDRDPEGYGQRFMNISVNMIDFPCPANHCWIKDYSENAGIKEILLGEGIIAPEIDVRNTGFVAVTLHEVLI